MAVNGDNKLKVSFSEPPTVNFALSDFLISVYGTNSYTIAFYQSSITDYLFALKFTNHIDAGTLVNLTILASNVYSTLGSRLENYNLNSTLALFNPVTMSPTAAVIAKQTTAASGTVVSTSVGAGMIGNPSGTWILINSIKIISYIPINANPLTPGLVAFFSGIGNFNIVPNPSTYLFSDSCTGSPYTEAYNYGIKISVF